MMINMLTDDFIDKVVKRCMFIGKNVEEIRYVDYSESSKTFVDGELKEYNDDDVEYTLWCGDEKNAYKHKFEMEKGEKYKKFFDRILPDLKSKMT